MTTSITEFKFPEGDTSDKGFEVSTEPSRQPTMTTSITEFKFPEGDTSEEGFEVSTEPSRQSTMTTSVTEFKFPEGDTSEEGFEYTKTTLASFLNNSRFSDVTVTLGTTEIELCAHRIILANESPRIYEFLLQKPDIEKIHLFLYNTSPHSVWRMIQYMYEGRYSASPAELFRSVEDDAELLKHSSVALIASEYLIEELEELALRRLRFQLNSWSSGELFDGIREMYASQNRRARNLVVTEMAKLHSGAPQLAQALQKAARELGEFAVDLLVALGSQKSVAQSKTRTDE